MSENKIKKVTLAQVDNELFGVHKAVDALRELCRVHEGGRLYDVVTERIDMEFNAVAQHIADNFNAAIDRVNEARARLVGEGVNMNATEGMGSFTTGNSIPVVIRGFGISRIGNSDAWCLLLNNEEIGGAVLKEADALRVMDAVSNWRDALAATEREG